MKQGMKKKIFRAFEAFTALLIFFIAFYGGSPDINYGVLVSILCVLIFNVAIILKVRR